MVGGSSPEKGGEIKTLGVLKVVPKTYLAMLLFFGSIFVLIGIEEGYAMIAISALLWFADKYKHKL